MRACIHQVEARRRLLVGAVAGAVVAGAWQRLLGRVATARPWLEGAVHNTASGARRRFEGAERNTMKGAVHHTESDEALEAREADRNIEPEARPRLG